MLYNPTLVLSALTSVALISEVKASGSSSPIFNVPAHKRATPSKSKSSSSGSSSNHDTPLSKLYPAGVHTNGTSGWTVVPSAPGSVPLNDNTLNPRNITSGLKHPFVTGPGGKPSMKATYPEGSFNFKHTPRGGIGFYAPGPSRVDWDTAKEVTLGYSIYFEAGFEWNLGGKLPGLYGGNDADESTGCSGGSRRVDCFSSRFMWRPAGQGELYTYLPNSNVAGYEANTRICDVAPYSECNPNFGASVGRGSFNFTSGHWNTVAQRVRMNDPGKDNGEIEVYANGYSKFFVTGLKLGDQTGLSRIRGIDMQTFFGGSNITYASPKTQHIYFADFSVAITHTRSETLKQSAPPPPTVDLQKKYPNRTSSSSLATLIPTKASVSFAQARHPFFCCLIVLEGLLSVLLYL